MGSIEASPKVKNGVKSKHHDWFTKFVHFAPPITANLNARVTYFSRVLLLEPKQ